MKGDNADGDDLRRRMSFGFLPHINGGLSEAWPARYQLILRVRKKGGERGSRRSENGLGKL